MKNRSHKITEIFLIASLPLAVLVACNGSDENQLRNDTAAAHNITPVTVTSRIFIDEQAMLNNEPTPTPTPILPPDLTETETVTRKQNSNLGQHALLEVMKQPTHTAIYFTANQFNLPERDRDALKEHALYLSYHPDVVLNITGFSDSVGRADVNFALSRQRAQNVRDVLLELGVTTAQLRLYAYGEAFSASSNNPHAIDRRVQLEYAEREYAKTAAR